MADFKISYQKTCNNENGYVNDPDDRGGETWDGISRNFWPHLIIWDIIDHYKKLPGFPANLRASSELVKAKEEFYLKNFWQRIRGDEINFQPTADQLFDSAVNVGVDTAIILEKRAAGLKEAPQMDDAFINYLNHAA